LALGHLPAKVSESRTDGPFAPAIGKSLLPTEEDLERRVGLLRRKKEVGPKNLIENLPRERAFMAQISIILGEASGSVSTKRVAKKPT
jgi:hypothetical protein